MKRKKSKPIKIQYRDETHYNKVLDLKPDCCFVDEDKPAKKVLSKSFDVKRKKNAYRYEELMRVSQFQKTLQEDKESELTVFGNKLEL